MNEQLRFYNLAYDLHYKKDDVLTAYVIYEHVIAKYGDTPEASYSISQIANIKTSGVKNFSLDLITDEIRERANNYIVGEHSIEEDRPETAKTYWADNKTPDSHQNDNAEAQASMHGDIRVIKNILIFFTVLAVVGIIAGIIFALMKF